MLHFIVKNLGLVLGQTVTRDLHETVDFVNVDVLDVLVARLIVAGLLGYFRHDLLSRKTYKRNNIYTAT